MTHLKLQKLQKGDITHHQHQWRRNLFGRHGQSRTTFSGGTALNVNYRTTFQAHETFNHHVSDSQSQQTELTYITRIQTLITKSYRNLDQNIEEPHPFGRRSKTAPFKQKYWLRHCKMLKLNTDTDYYRDRGAKLPTYCVT